MGSSFKKMWRRSIKGKNVQKNEEIVCKIPLNVLSLLKKIKKDV